jgi:hypothetical protein
MSKNKYLADLSINKFKIDDEILKQAQLYYEWSIKAAEAEIEKDNAKDSLDLSIIEAERKIRKFPEKYFGDKTPTELAIKNKVNNNKEVKAALAKYNRARDNYKLISKAEKAFEQRKRMIECYLFRINRGQNSEVKVPYEHRKKMQKEIQDEIKTDLLKTLKRR